MELEKQHVAVTRNRGNSFLVLCTSEYSLQVENYMEKVGVAIKITCVLIIMIQCIYI